MIQGPASELHSTGSAGGHPEERAHSLEAKRALSKGEEVSSLLLFLFNQSWWITADPGDWGSDSVGMVLKIGKS